MSTFKMVFAGLLVLLVAFGRGTSLSAQQAMTLVINGHPDEVPVLRQQNRYYVDLESLARLTNGSVAFQGNRIVLTLPAATPSQSSLTLSREFMRFALVAVAEIKSWKDVVGTAIAQGLPPGPWIDAVPSRSAEALRVASVSASTAGDKLSVQLLNNDFANMQAWHDAAVAERRHRNAEPSITPGAVSNDAQLQKVTDCEAFFNQMLVSGTYADSSACH